MPANKILVATDFSTPAERAFDEAMALAQATGDELEIVHVHAVTSMSVPPMLDIATRMPSPEAVVEAEQRLAAWVERGRAAGLSCTSYAAFGSPADEVIRRAREVTPRLAVVGTHGRGLVRHLLLGSTAERIVKAAPCPVLIVPPAQ